MWKASAATYRKSFEPTRSDDTLKDFCACECYYIKIKDKWKTLIIVRRLLKCCDCSHSLLWYYLLVVPGYVSSVIVANYQIRTGTNKALKVAKCYLASRSFRYVPWIVQTWEVRIFFRASFLKLVKCPPV